MGADDVAAAHTAARIIREHAEQRRREYQQDDTCQNCGRQEAPHIAALFRLADELAAR